MFRTSTDADYLRDGTVTLDADGIPLEWSSKADVDDVEQKVAGLHHYRGTGFPEGRVAAPVGAVYTDTAATNGAVQWIKASGTGNTGWNVSSGDTGQRDITSLITPAAGGGRLYVRRLADRLVFQFDYIPQGSEVMTVPIIPGWFPVLTTSIPLTGSSAQPVGRMHRAWRNSYIELHLTGTATCIVTVEFPKATEWPTTLLGTPA